ncbi:hypothetical protein KEJ45_01180 [Candidatus Bathyarchaeota archaeon]|nr:hypothetical protein [Candidatus Bathyarchaeota archaeon]
MKRKFADLHLQPNLCDVEHTRRMVKKAAALGYSLIAVPLPYNVNEDYIRRLRDFCHEATVDFASRLDLKPKTPDELTSMLRKFRRKFEIIAVICDSKNVARQAAKDRRVDLLNFPSADFRKRFFDRAESELASSSLAALEIDAKPLITLKGPDKVRLLSALRAETIMAKAYRVPLVISSGAANEMLMRKPLEMAAFASLFDLDKSSAIEAVSKNPLGIVKRNREKLDSKFVAPGIRVIRSGKDC